MTSDLEDFNLVDGKVDRLRVKFVSNGELLQTHLSSPLFILREHFMVHSSKVVLVLLENLVRNLLSAWSARLDARTLRHFDNQSLRLSLRCLVRVRTLSLLLHLLGLCLRL